VTAAAVLDLIVGETPALFASFGPERFTGVAA
jgi:hypothetical protein